MSVISPMQSGRAPGSDGIAAELLKYAITPVAKALHFLFTRIWRTGHIPADWKDGILVTLYKGKGPVADWSQSHCSTFQAKFSPTCSSQESSHCSMLQGDYNSQDL